MSDPDHQTVSAWYGADEISDLESFDEHFASRRGPSWSRSEEIKRAMRVHHVADEVMAARDCAPDDMRERESIIRQALYDYFRDD